MKNSLFDKTYSDIIIQRINALNSNSRPRWGKMSVDRMLAHCQCPLRVASGEMKLKRTFIGMLLGNWARKKFTKDETPFDHNMPTDKHFIISDPKVFEEEKAKLITLVQTFTQKGEAGLTKETHPFFGAMTPHEWDTLQWKHLDHHLRQFGV